MTCGVIVDSGVGYLIFLLEIVVTEWICTRLLGYCELYGTAVPTLREVPLKWLVVPIIGVPDIF